MKLWLAWEAVQDFYITYCNIAAYKYGLKELFPYIEDTYLIKIDEGKIHAYYDEDNLKKAGEEGLKLYLSTKWRESLKESIIKAISEAQSFCDTNCGKVEGQDKKELSELLMKATDIVNELFTYFMATQVQYTSLLNQHLLQELNEHEEKFEIIKILTEGDEKKKKKTIEEYRIPDEIVLLCNDILEIGKLRLSLRTDGWVPMSDIIYLELIKELAKHMDYNASSLNALTHEEMKEFLNGKYAPDREELEKRKKHVLFGLLKGKEILLSGEEAEKKFVEIAPKINKNVKELKGQTAMGGHVEGKCYVIHWHSKTLSEDIKKMPENSILVAGQTRPEIMQAIKKASAIVTDEGGVLSHAAVVSRELGIPCVIGTRYATHILKTGDNIVVDADKGVMRIK